VMVATVEGGCGGARGGAVGGVVNHISSNRKRSEVATNRRWAAVR
jgi:hypothetical protein